MPNLRGPDPTGLEAFLHISDSNEPAKFGTIFLSNRIKKHCALKENYFQKELKLYLTSKIQQFFDQWSKLHLHLNVHTETPISNVI